MKIPQKGMSKEEILKTLKNYKGHDLDWKSGRVFGYIYDPGEKVHDVINDAYTLYLAENGLDPLSFPSLLRLENEVVSMTANLLDCDHEVVGNFSSGGTESLILAVKTSRDYARATRPQIKEPEMVLPITAHASLFKAAHYLGLKPVVTPVHDNTFLADVAAMRDAITDNTILLVCSAPGYAHGVVDPITEIAALAKENGLLCHVDACVGGIHLTYMRRLGYDVPDFNLNVPGVTSLSVDLHKYGYAAKGASIVLYKNKELRKFQIWACSRWTGYTVINPAVTSSKSGGPMAAAWAVLKYIGDDGYMKIVADVMQATQNLIEGIAHIDGLKVLGQPSMCMFALASTNEKINVYRLADKMKVKGWYLQPQFARENSPSNLHVSMNRSTAPRAKSFLKAFEETVAEMKREEVDQETRDLQAELKKLALNFDEETFFKLAEMAGVTGVEPPENMEKINMLLEALPYDVSEFMLTEYLNNMMLLGQGAEQ
ncbi:Pyridoxal-dependent decarboxylase [Olavius sp. associated proteobacterium Delta 1]|nr:Pyridoxal-dependent decarboxylase [Olavius sp. associated proteobacterium Delta 1]